MSVWIEQLEVDKASKSTAVDSLHSSRFQGHSFVWAKTAIIMAIVSLSIKQSMRRMTITELKHKNWIVLKIFTSAVYSISMKSFLASAVMGSPGVVTHSINITFVFSVGALVNIWKQQKESNWKKFHWNGTVTCLLALILCVSCLLLFYYLTYKRTNVWENFLVFK